MTGEKAADEIGVSQGQLSRMESAHRTVSKSQLRALLAVYGAPESDQALLLEIHGQLRRPAWWEGMGVPEGTYVDLESEAHEIRSFDLSLLSGLLQTREYAEPVIRAMAPDVSEHEVTKRVDVRLERTELLDQGLKLWAILDEAAVQRAVGGRPTQINQLRYLLERAQLPNVTIQVLPFDTGEHIGMDGSFSLLTFEDHPPLGYVEQFGRGLWLEKEAEIRRTQFHWEHLLSTALKPQSSLDMIRDIAQEAKQ